MSRTKKPTKKQYQSPVWNGAEKQAQKLCNHNTKDDKYLASDAKRSSQSLWGDFVEINRYQDHRLMSNNATLRKFVPLLTKFH
jgi:hypothetical protein